jgi:cytochrome P450
MNLYFQLDDPDFYLQDSQDAYRQLRERAPVYWCESGRFWALSKHADILNVSRNPAQFRSGGGVLAKNDPLRMQNLADRTLPSDAKAPSIIFMDPPEHNRYRRLVTHAFTPRRVAALEPLMRGVVRKCLDEIEPGEAIDFVDRLSVPLPILVIGEMLGVPAADRADFRRWSDAVVEAAETNEADLFQAIGEFFAYLQARIDERRRKPSDDLISVLIQAEVDGDRLGEGDILLFCQTLLVAGNETTRNLISGGALALIDHPEQKQKLVDDPSLVAPAVEEMLRWVTPVTSFARTAVRDCEMRGQRIAAGDYLVMLYASGNRDEEVWGPSAGQFDVTRGTDSTHLAFGFGQHMCLGANLARLEARVLFEELLARRPHFELAGEVERLRSTLINGVVRMPVVLR